MTYPRYDAVDLFAGCGGWSVGLRSLGGREIGVETDTDCRATRRAAGFHTLQGDVQAYGPGDLPTMPGLTASPPCQTFSVAGKGTGRGNLDAVLLAVKATAARLPVEVAWSDTRTGLVVEPLRWAVEAIDAGRPYRWIALEQVRPVLPVWEAIAEALVAEGYHVATGIVHAEQYGVPQTRARAVLLAHLDRPVALPTPTHSRYYARDKTRLDPDVLPWVSMAEALGWGMTARPYPTVAGSRATGGLDKEKVGGSGARAQIYAELAAERWIYERPATTIVGSFRPEIVAAPGYRVSPADGSRQNAPGSIRVTLDECALLQSFPPDYPWRGSKSGIGRQIGNAIPPLLARALLAEVIS